MEENPKRGRQRLPDDYLEVVRPQLERLRSTAVPSPQPSSLQGVVRHEAAFLQELRALGHSYKDIAAAMSTDGYQVDPATLVTCISRRKADVTSATPLPPSKRTKPKKPAQAHRRQDAPSRDSGPTVLAPPVDKGGSTADQHPTTTPGEDSPITARSKTPAARVPDTHASTPSPGTTDLFEVMALPEAQDEDRPVATSASTAPNLTEESPPASRPLGGSRRSRFGPLVEQLDVARD